MVFSISSEMKPDDIKIVRSKENVAIKTSISTIEVPAKRIPEIAKALMEVAGYL